MTSRCIYSRDCVTTPVVNVTNTIVQDVNSNNFYDWLDPAQSNVLLNDFGGTIGYTTQLTGQPVNLSSFNDDLVHVTSVNGLSGALNVAAGDNVTLGQVGNTITVNAVQGAAATWETLGGNQAAINVGGFNNDAGYLSSVDGLAVTSLNGISGVASILPGTNATVEVDTQAGTITVGSVLPPEGFTSINSMYGELQILSGEGISLLTGFQSITISATGGGGRAYTFDGSGAVTVTGPDPSNNVLIEAPLLLSAYTNDTGFLTAGTLPASVDSFNGLTGNVTLAAGNNVTLDTVGNTITINSTATGGGGGVSSLNTLTGAVTVSGQGNVSVTPVGNDLQIAYSAPAVTWGSITGDQSSIDLNGFANTSGYLLPGNIVAGTGMNIVNTQGYLTFNVQPSGVTSLNSLSGDLVISAGSDITVTPVGNSLQISNTYTAPPVAWTDLTGLQTEIDLSGFGNSQGYLLPVNMLPGTGISLTKASGNVTINNTATTTTLNGQSGALTVQGAGSTTVSTVGSTITVSSPQAVSGYTNDVGYITTTQAVTGVNNVQQAVYVLAGERMNVTTSAPNITLNADPASEILKQISAPTTQYGVGKMYYSTATDQLMLYANDPSGTPLWHRIEMVYEAPGKLVQFLDAHLLHDAAASYIQANEVPPIRFVTNGPALADYNKIDGIGVVLYNWGSHYRDSISAPNTSRVQPQYKAYESMVAKIPIDMLIQFIYNGAMLIQTPHLPYGNYSTGAPFLEIQTLQDIAMGIGTGLTTNPFEQMVLYLTTYKNDRFWRASDEPYDSNFKDGPDVVKLDLNSLNTMTTVSDPQLATAIYDSNNVKIEQMVTMHGDGTVCIKRVKTTTWTENVSVPFAIPAVINAAIIDLPFNRPIYPGVDLEVEVVQPTIPNLIVPITIVNEETVYDQCYTTSLINVTNPWAVPAVYGSVVYDLEATRPMDFSVAFTGRESWAQLYAYWFGNRKTLNYDAFGLPTGASVVASYVRGVQNHPNTFVYLYSYDELAYEDDPGVRYYAPSDTPYDRLFGVYYRADVYGALPWTLNGAGTLGPQTSFKKIVEGEIEYTAYHPDYFGATQDPVTGDFDYQQLWLNFAGDSATGWLYAQFRANYLWLRYGSANYQGDTYAWQYTEDQNTSLWGWYNTHIVNAALTPSNINDLLVTNGYTRINLPFTKDKFGWHPTIFQATTAWAGIAQADLTFLKNKILA